MNDKIKVIILAVIRESAQMTLKDWLDIIIIPVSLAIIALIWPIIQQWNRRCVFMDIIHYELKEAGPAQPKEEKSGWWEHLSRNFVHRGIITNVSSNRDFILSLKPLLVYHISQLWDAFDAKDDEQWIHHLYKLSKAFAKYDKAGKLSEIYHAWKELCNQYRDREKRPLIK